MAGAGWLVFWEYRINEACPQNVAEFLPLFLPKYLLIIFIFFFNDTTLFLLPPNCLSHVFVLIYGANEEAQKTFLWRECHNYCANKFYSITPQLVLLFFQLTFFHIAVYYNLSTISSVVCWKINNAFQRMI